MIGRTLGRFRVVAALGTGGMARVWRAHDKLLGRDLALKILSESLAQSEDARRRFRHEATIASQLDHPAIAAVFDSGETEGLTWIAMALIDGETMAERLGRSLIPVSEVVATALVVADALGYAHAHGVIHRDVTSRNVMLGRDGRVFVLDFGLALAEGASRISSSGTTVGTAPYMAPELLLGGRANERSDLYGLGVVMYEALTGAVPFPATGAAAAAFSALHETARPVREWRPEVSAGLEAIVMRCLAREPAQRFGSAREMVDAIKALDTPARQATPGGGGATGGMPAPRNGTKATAAVDAPGRSNIATRLFEGDGPVYLAIPEFEVAEGEEALALETRAIARGLTASSAAAISQLQRVHVVRTEVPPPGRLPDALRAYARALGVQALVLGELRRSGTRLRATYVVCDPEASLQIAGDSLEGSTLDPFELEDSLIASLRHLLARERVDSQAVTREKRSDPAAAEHFQQALRYLEHHDHEASVDGAIGLLEKLAVTDAQTLPAHATLARALLFKYELTKKRVWEARAAAAAAEATRLAPDAPETLLALGDLHRNAGRFVEAEHEYGLALAQRPGCYEALLGRAWALSSLGRPDEADAICLSATDARPADWRGHSLLGWLRFTRGRYEDSIAPWREAARLSPGSARVARNLGSALFHLDRFDDAVSAFERSLELEPSAAGFTNLGTVHFYRGAYEAALAAFEKSVALNPSDAVLWANLGSACRFVPGRETQAKEALERAVGLMREHLERNPGEAESRARLAGALINLDRRPEAIEAIEEALRREPENVHCLARALHVYWQIGDRARALHWTREALRHGYGPEALRRSPDLSGLRADPEFQELLSRYPEKTGSQLPGLDGREEKR